MDVDVEMKVIKSRVANHLHLLRIEGVPKIQGFLFKMELLLPNHIGLSGPERIPGMWDFCCETWESSRCPWMD